MSLVWATSTEDGETTSETTEGEITMRFDHPTERLRRWTLGVWVRDFDGCSVSLSWEFRTRPSDTVVRQLGAIVLASKHEADRMVAL